LRAVLALAVGLAIVFVRELLRARLGAEVPFFFTWIAIFCTAWIGGIASAMVVAAVGLAYGQHVLSIHHERLLGPGAMVISALFAIAFALPAEIYHRATRRRKADAERYAELQLRMSKLARLNAMGELVGTLAHELNQPLTAILAYADVVQLQLAQEDVPAETLRELVQKVTKQGNRARDIVARVRASLSGTEVSLERQSLAQMLEEAVELSLASAVRDGVVVKYDLEPHADQVLADRIEIQQVMVNLLRNAAEAMAGARRREVHIKSRVVEGNMLECEVADCGPGIAPEILPNLFQPFATGKAHGMGIGLAVSRTIVEAHGGRIWADSTPGKGASFRFTLNRAEAMAAE
jgi:two-component system sensor kinase FixL